MSDTPRTDKLLEETANVFPDQEHNRLVAHARELERGNGKYIQAFRHMHIAGQAGDLDRCAKCGLDLRDPIHASAR